jgi:hypothetical protein
MGHYRDGEDEDTGFIAAERKVFWRQFVADLQLKHVLWGYECNAMTHDPNPGTRTKISFAGQVMLIKGPCWH